MRIRNTDRKVAQDLPGIDMPVVELLVEVEEESIVRDVGQNVIWLRPRGRLKNLNKPQLMLRIILMLKVKLKTNQRIQPVVGAYTN